MERNLRNPGPSGLVADLQLSELVVNGVRYVRAQDHLTVRAIEDTVCRLWAKGDWRADAPWLPDELRVIISDEKSDIEGEEGVSVAEFTALLLQAEAAAEHRE